MLYTVRLVLKGTAQKNLPGNNFMPPELVEHSLKAAVSIQGKMN